MPSLQVPLSYSCLFVLFCDPVSLTKPMYVITGWKSPLQVASTSGDSSSGRGPHEHLFMPAYWQAHLVRATKVVFTVAALPQRWPFMSLWILHFCPPHLLSCSLMIQMSWLGVSTQLPLVVRIIFRNHKSLHSPSPLWSILYWYSGSLSSTCWPQNANPPFWAYSSTGVIDIC